MVVVIQRLHRGRWIAVGVTLLRHDRPGDSRFSSLAIVHPGFYRLLANVTDGAHLPAYSQIFRVR